MAHELRNVLLVAESVLFLAQRDVDDRGRLLGHLDRATTEIRKAQEIIGSVLGLSRGEPVRRESIAVASVLGSARHEVPSPEGIAVEAHVTPPELSVVCDPLLLERVLDNLLRNAVEALAGRGGKVIARARAEGGRVLFEVEDDGPGLSPAIADRIFDPLVTGKAYGTGLGLPLCRIIVQAHGGAIEVGPRTGGGTVVRFWLPEE
jgi:signal transduction histidine kinase